MKNLCHIGPLFNFLLLVSAQKMEVLWQHSSWFLSFSYSVSKYSILSYIIPSPAFFPFISFRYQFHIFLIIYFYLHCAMRSPNHFQWTVFSLMDVAIATKSCLSVYIHFLSLVLMYCTWQTSLSLSLSLRTEV